MAAATTEWTDCPECDDAASVQPIEPGRSYCHMCDATLIDPTRYVGPIKSTWIILPAA